MSPSSKRLGRKVTLPPTSVPARYLTTPCACCGQDRRLVNGRWLAYLRTTARVDQRALAKTVGVSGPYLSDIERNRRDVPEDVLLAYLKIGGVE